MSEIITKLFAFFADKVGSRAAVAILSFLPIAEARVSLPLSLSYGISPTVGLLLSFIGSTLPVVTVYPLVKLLIKKGKGNLRRKLDSAYKKKTEAIIKKATPSQSDKTTHSQSDSSSSHSDHSLPVISSGAARRSREISPFQPNPSTPSQSNHSTASYPNQTNDRPLPCHFDQANDCERVEKSLPSSHSDHSLPVSSGASAPFPCHFDQANDCERVEKSLPSSHSDHSLPVSGAASHNQRNLSLSLSQKGSTTHNEFNPNSIKVLSALTGFVALPLPLTGVWSGIIIASLLGGKAVRSALAIALGNLIACLILLTLSVLFAPYINIIVTVITLIAITVALITLIKVIKQIFSH